MMMISKTIMMAGAGLSVVDGLQVKSVVNQSTIAKPATEIVGTIKEGNPGNPDADTKVGQGSEYCFDNLPRHTAGSDVWSKLELDDGTIYCYLRIASNKKVKYLSKMMFDKLLKDNEDADFDDVFCAALNCRLENVDDGKEITNLSLDMKVRLCWTFGHVGTIKKGNPGSPDADTKVGEGSEYCFDNLPGCGRWRKLELADGKIYCYLRTASNKKVKYLSEQMFDKLLKDNKDANLDDVFCAALDCRLENEDGKEITKLTLNKKVQLFHALEGDEDDWDSDNSLVGGDGNWRRGDEDGEPWSSDDDGKAGQFADESISADELSSDDEVGKGVMGSYTFSFTLPALEDGAYPETFEQLGITVEDCGEHLEITKIDDGSPIIRNVQIGDWIERTARWRYTEKSGWKLNEVESQSSVFLSELKKYAKNKREHEGHRKKEFTIHAHRFL